MIKEKQNDAGVIIVDARTPQEHFQARIQDLSYLAGKKD